MTASLFLYQFEYCFSYDSSDQNELVGLFFSLDEICPLSRIDLAFCFIARL